MKKIVFRGDRMFKPQNTIDAKHCKLETFGKLLDIFGNRPQEISESKQVVQPHMLTLFICLLMHTQTQRNYNFGFISGMIISKVGSGLTASRACLIR